MRTFTKTIEINRPAADVELACTDWTQYPEIVPFFQDVLKLDDHTVDFQVKVAGMLFQYTAEVEKAGEGIYRWKTRRGEVPHRGEVRIEALDDRRTRLTLTIELERSRPSLGGRVRHWMRLADSSIRFSMENFRVYAESL